MACSSFKVDCLPTVSVGKREDFEGRGVDILGERKIGEGKARGFRT